MSAQDPGIRPKRRPTVRGLVAGLAVAAAATAYWGLHHAAPAAGTAGQAAPPTTAQVTVGRIEWKQITATAVAYGSVVARPGKSNALSLPFEGVVRHVLVAPGEPVAGGQAVLEIGPSPATQLRIGQARAAAGAADEELRQTTERYNLKLATNQEMSQARKAADTTRLEWESLAGSEREAQLTSGELAIVGRVLVQDGQFVPAGQPLIELVPHHEIEVKLGVEPGDAPALKVGDPVALFAADAPAPVEGRIRLITQRVSPDTRLVDVYVVPAAGATLRLGEYLRAELHTASSTGLVVPRAAVLPEGDANVLFTVSNGRVARHAVELRLQTGQQVEVVGSQLQAGQQVVVGGNHELSDGMAVNVAPVP